jgi:hypothetical protein
MAATGVDGCRMVNDPSRIVKGSAPDPMPPETRAAVSSWTSAEESLYGPLLADRQAYERVVQLVGTLVDHLRVAAQDVPALLAASGRGADLVAEVAPEQALPWVPLEAALRAACAMRYRELLTIRKKADRVAKMTAASAAGEPWVRVVDADSVAAPVVAPALVVHLPTGRGISCSTEMDPETGGARFVSTPVVVDLVSGEVTGALEAAGAPRAAASVAGRDEDVRTLQGVIEGLDSTGRVG